MEYDFYEMYLEELKAVAPLSEEERQEVLRRAALGDEGARRRLVEGSLRDMPALVKEFEGRELPMADLIQEANTALMLAAVEYDGAAAWEAFVTERVRQAVELALAEQRQEKMAEETLAARVNVLQTVSQVMAEELGREATVEELAQRMKMTEDEIKDIMKLALDALTVSGDGQGGEEEG